MKEPNNIELDDLQQLRHGARVVGEYMAVYYRELRTAGVPRKLARKLAFDQWIQVRTSEQTNALQQALEAFMQQLGGGSPDDE